MSETILRSAACLGAGVLVSRAVKTGDVYLWLISGLIIAAIIFDLVLKYRDSLRSVPPLKTYIVTMKFDDSDDTDKVEVKARSFDEAKTWAYLEKPSYDRHRWNVVLVQEKMS